MIDEPTTEAVRITWARRRLLARIGAASPALDFRDATQVTRDLLDRLAAGGYVERREAAGLGPGWSYGWYLTDRGHIVLSQPAAPYTEQHRAVFHAILVGERICYWPPTGSPEPILQSMRKRGWIEIAETDKACSITTKGHALLADSHRVAQQSAKITAQWQADTNPEKEEP